jgi:hypothetical protein
VIRGEQEEAAAVTGEDSGSWSFDRPIERAKIFSGERVEKNRVQAVRADVIWILATLGIWNIFPCDERGGDDVIADE